MSNNHKRKMRFRVGEIEFETFANSDSEEKISREAIKQLSERFQLHFGKHQFEEKKALVYAAYQLLTEEKLLKLTQNRAKEESLIGDINSSLSNFIEEETVENKESNNKQKE